MIRAGEAIQVIGLGRMSDSIKVGQVYVGRGKARKIGRGHRRDGGRFPILEPNPDDVPNAIDRCRLRLRLKAAARFADLSVQPLGRGKNNDPCDDR